MAAIPVTEAGGVLSGEIGAFAAQQGVEALLACLVDMTGRVFPNAREFQLSVEEDLEIADERHFVFAVRIAGMSEHQAVEASEEWHRELVRLCPAHVRCGFQLSMGLAD
jgi:hypothetical protein